MQDPQIEEAIAHLEHYQQAQARNILKNFLQADKEAQDAVMAFLLRI